MPLRAPAQQASAARRCQVNCLLLPPSQAAWCTRTVWVYLIDKLGGIKVLCVKHVRLALEGRLERDGWALLAALRRCLGHGLPGSSQSELLEVA